jgi:hypothetical protein
MPDQMSCHAGSPVPAPRVSLLPHLPRDPAPNEDAGCGDRAASDTADGGDRVMVETMQGRWPRVFPGL